MSSPNVAPQPIPHSAEFVPSLPSSRPHSLKHTPSFIAPGDLSYSFINPEFVNDSQVKREIGASFTFRNLTSTPRFSHPASLPKSLPIDWNLFNQQFELQQRRKLAYLKRKLENDIENNFENLPYQVINFIADCIESQNDLINLSLTCKFFNKMINQRLYRKIILVDNISDKCMHYDGTYTLVDSTNYPKFLATLHSNGDLIQLIKVVIIDTSSNNSSYDSLQDNIYSGLYDLFLTNNNNLQVLENLDFNNLKKFDSLLRYNKDHLIKHNYNKYAYFYPSSENIEELLSDDLLHLKNFQIMDMNDLNSLPLSTTSLSLLLEHEFRLQDPFKLLYSGFKTLQNLTTLKLHTPVAFESFVNELYELFNSSSSRITLSRLSNIRTLSIANVHGTDNGSSRISFKKLNTIMDLSSVRNLEIKTRCLEKVQCNSCALQFMMDWWSTFGESRSDLERLSIISLPPNINRNINIQWDSIIRNPGFMRWFGENVQFLFINLNDFPFVPIFEKTIALEAQNHQRLPINTEVLTTRKQMYSNILQSFKKLDLLIIPDFFYNWAVYNNIQDLSNDENLNFLNFLDSCHCVNCCESRLLFKSYSSQHQFKDFKGHFQSTLQYGARNNQQLQEPVRYNKLNGNPDDYRILYNYLLREIKSRIPLKQLNKVQCSLDYDMFVPNVRFRSPVIPQGDFDKLTKLFVHGLRPEIQRLIETLPKLKKFNLGGILFKCHRSGRGKIRVRAVYDDFDEVFDVTS